VNQPEDEPSPKPFRVQRLRLGTIRFYREDGEFGFIEAEDFREDVFFHRRAWEAEASQPQAETSQGPGKAKSGRPPRLIEPEVDMWVEFELDDEHFAEEKKLRAKVVRPSSRPEGRRMTARDAKFRVTYHHPNARKKRPTWRE
jgi:hypothetical protein